jgi:hypothetical protein
MNLLAKTILVAGVALAAWTFAGCQPAAPVASNTSPAEPAHADVAANLAKLPAEDQPLAVAQGYCVIQSNEKLGSMGVPIKVMVKDEPVFVCCKGCEKKAIAGGDATLAKVAELKAKVTAEKTSTP